MLKRGLGLARRGRAERAQFGGAAQHAVDEEAMHHRAQRRTSRRRSLRMNVVGHAAAEPAVPAAAVEPQQMVAIAVGFADPQFADQAAVGERILHFGSPDIAVRRPPWTFIPETAVSRGCTANQ